MNNEMKELIKNHLEVIDMYNEMNNGKATVGTKNLIAELMGMKMLLNTMGLILDIDINPYFYENKQPSTYAVRLEA
jgi:hypothetical protein